MKSHSPRDRAFLHKFAEKLSQARKKAREVDNTSFEAFAQLLGVTRAGLHKYLKEQSMPSLDILERARQLGVEVKYGELDLGLIKRRAKRNESSTEAQMLLPLAIESLTQQNITVEVGQKRPNAIELNVTIRFSSKRAHS
jgi:transcriptional regulator with XRE-family HTH domain